MKRRLTCVVWAGVMLAAAQEPTAVGTEKDKPKCPDVRQTEKDQFNGTWALEQLCVGETEVKKDTPIWKAAKDLRLTFKDGHVVIQGDETLKPRKEVYSVDAGKSPKQLDIGQGQSVKEYIYKFEDGKLIVAFAPGVLVAGGTFAEVQRRTLRPRDFKKTTETAPPNVWVFKRVKP